MLSFIVSTHYSTNVNDNGKMFTSLIKCLYFFFEWGLMYNVPIFKIKKKYSTSPLYSNIVYLSVSFL